MKKWTILCIPLLFVLFTLTEITYKSMSQAASMSLNPQSEFNLTDAPHSNTANINRIHAETTKSQPSLLQRNPHHSNKERVLSTTSSKESHSQISSSPPIVTQGLLPTVNYRYTYAPSFDGAVPKTYVASINPYVPNAVDLIEKEFHGYTFIESEEHLQLGIAFSDVFFFSLSYPMIEHATTVDTDYGFDSNYETEVLVESTTTTLTTQAGTFENVIVIRYPNGSTLYLAEGFGIIRITDFDGEITTELISRN